MSNLSEALKKYYSREGKRIVFRDARSLNQLALAMWEELGFEQIDASVLSRVLSGERLFTARQLKVFCTLLLLSKSEEEYLFLCLGQDQNVELNQYIDTTYVSSPLALQIIREFTRDSFDMFYRADYNALQKRYELIQRLASTYVLSNDRQAIVEVLGLNLYLKGRTILHGSSASQAIKNVYPVFKQLLEMSHISQSSMLSGYAHALLSDVYYGAGGYSDSRAKYKYYRTSIELAKKAIDILPIDDRESLFALRTMVASAHYMHDDQVVGSVMKRSKAIIPMQPMDNYVNVLHLNMTLGKACAAPRLADPFMIQEYAMSRFERDLTHTGLHEISGIKEEIETLLLLKTDDKKYIEGRLRRGIDLAVTYKFARHKRYLSKLLREL